MEYFKEVIFYLIVMRDASHLKKIEFLQSYIIMSENISGGDPVTVQNLLGTGKSPYADSQLSAKFPVALGHDLTQCQALDCHKTSNLDVSHVQKTGQSTSDKSWYATLLCHEHNTGKLGDAPISLRSNASLHGISEVRATAPGTKSFANKTSSSGTSGKNSGTKSSGAKSSGSGSRSSTCSGHK